MAKRKTKGKTKPKAKTKAKPKSKAKAKPKSKLKTKPRVKLKAKPKAKAPVTGPGTVYPQICSPFSAGTGATVSWQGVPPAGCRIDQDPMSAWPFNVGPPIHLPSPVTIKISAGSGNYTIDVECCADHSLKTVTVP